MDRFKFRVWDKVSKQYFYLELKLGDNGFHPDFIQEPMFEQCTGLKDKNGNLIYEGDIIHEVDKEADIDDVSQIVWRQDTCTFLKFDLPDTGLDRHCILCDTDSPYIEIIGNIHEQKD